MKTWAVRRRGVALINECRSFLACLSLFLFHWVTPDADPTELSSSDIVNMDEWASTTVARWCNRYSKPILFQIYSVMLQSPWPLRSSGHLRAKLSEGRDCFYEEHDDFQLSATSAPSEDSTNVTVSGWSRARNNSGSRVFQRSPTWFSKRFVPRARRDRQKAAEPLRRAVNRPR